jgi:hypothetical protein
MPNGLVWRCAAWTSTFLFVVTTWVLFRAADLATARRIFDGMLGRSATPANPVEWIGWALVAGALVWILVLPTSHVLMHRVMRNSLYADYLREARLRWWPVWRPNLGWSIASGVVFAIAFLGLSRVSEFIYYQF